MLQATEGDIDSFPHMQFNRPIFYCSLPRKPKTQSLHKLPEIHRLRLKDDKVN
ncbi:hypothetical protein HanIR_Chr01g0021211 [Helianthus annuus]|nr:hypothetical protein HanIR_Chr01g0021211 [Helianthus annuus]